MANFGSASRMPRFRLPGKIDVFIIITGSCEELGEKMNRVLVVEDDELIRNLIVWRLQEKNYEVLTASNGKDAVAMAQAEIPDLILMDLRLPLVNGWEATRQIKASAKTNAIPVIALTAAASTSERTRILEAGCDSYAAKPLEFSTLFVQIETLLRK